MLKSKIIIESETTEGLIKGLKSVIEYVEYGYNRASVLSEEEGEFYFSFDQKET